VRSPVCLLCLCCTSTEKGSAAACCVHRSLHPPHACIKSLSSSSSPSARAREPASGARVIVVSGSLLAGSLEGPPPTMLCQHLCILIDELASDSSYSAKFWCFQPCCRCPVHIEPCSGSDESTAPSIRIVRPCQLSWHCANCTEQSPPDHTLVVHVYELR